MSETSSSGKWGVAIVANDNIIEWLLPFLESFRLHNSDLPLFLIPYDNNIEHTRHAADVYRAHWVDDDMAELDDLARRLYPMSPYRRRRLRKLQALVLPLDRVIYIDVDTLIFRKFDVVFDRLKSGESEFIVASTSDDYVYNQKYAEFDCFKGVKLFSDGFFLTSRQILGLRDFSDILAAEEALFHQIRKRGALYAQPLVNFVVHRRQLKVKSLAECITDASDETFYKVETASLREDGPVDVDGKKIYFIHWAGAIQTPKNNVFDGAWREFSLAAKKRMTDALPTEMSAPLSPWRLGRNKWP